MASSFEEQYTESVLVVLISNYFFSELFVPDGLAFILSFMVQMTPKKTKLVLSGVGICLFGAVVVTTIYIPQYSQAGQSRREAYKKDGTVLKVPHRHMPANVPTEHNPDWDKPVRRPGSVYENMDKHAKKERKD